MGEPWVLVNTHELLKAGRNSGFQTVDKALREIMFLGAFFYHYKDVWV